MLRRISVSAFSLTTDSTDVGAPGQTISSATLLCATVGTCGPDRNGERPSEASRMYCQVRGRCTM